MGAWFCATAPYATVVEAAFRAELAEVMVAVVRDHAALAARQAPPLAANAAVERLPDP